MSKYDAREVTKTMALYDGRRQISEDEVLQKVKYFYDRAGKAMEYWSAGDKRTALNLAKEIRNELREEYKNNDLARIEKYYGEDINFVNYRAAVHEAYASIIGQTTYQNAFSFLYDVQSYMSYYFPKIRKKTS